MGTTLDQQPLPPVASPADLDPALPVWVELRAQYNLSQRMLLAARLYAENPHRTAAVSRGKGAELPIQYDFERALGIGQGAINEVHRVQRGAAPEVVEAIAAGKITVGAASRLKKLPFDVQLRRLDDLIKGARGPNARQVSGHATPGFARLKTQAPIADQFQRGVATLDTVSQVLDDGAAQAALDVRAVQWAKALRSIRGALTRTIRVLEETTVYANRD